MANIFEIQKFSYYDGPGIRTVIFFKGCNMVCKWCQNPESRSFKKELMFNEKNCTLCGKCVERCPNNCHIIKNGVHHLDRKLCVACGKCTEECYSNALQLTGREISIEEVMAEILTDAQFYKISGGGVTLSGGEPLLQEEACYEILSGCRKHYINTAVQTAGNVEWKVFKKLLPLTDYLMFDIKTLDERIHKLFCGTSNTNILRNLEMLKKSKVNLIVRLPIIPGVNDKKSNIEAIGQKVKDFPNLKNIELIPFHKFGKSKYVQLGIDFETENIVEHELDDIEILKKILTDMKIPAVINYKT